MRSGIGLAELEVAGRTQPLRHTAVIVAVLSGVIQRPLGCTGRHWNPDAPAPLPNPASGTACGTLGCVRRIVRRRTPTHRSGKAAAAMRPAPYSAARQPVSADRSSCRWAPSQAAEYVWSVTDR